MEIISLERFRRNKERVMGREEILDCRFLIFD
jgi:hypothetical protein